jgi:hypothetical protein
MRQLVFIISVAAIVGLGGCASIKRMTGQINDTVLPGQREDVLAPDQQTARDPVVTGQQAKPCDPTITTCPDLMQQ